MKKRVLSLLLVLGILFSLGATAYATDESRVFIGTLTHQVNDEAPEQVSAKMDEFKSEYSNYNMLWIDFTHEDFYPYDQPYLGYFYPQEGSEEFGFTAYISTYCESMKYGRFVVLSDTQRYIEYEVTAYGNTYKVSGYLTLEGIDPGEPVILEKVISGMTTSKTGEYMISIGGKVKGEFVEGRQQITAGGQEITIFAMNTLNGATRVMASNTINSMYVTVEGGVITKVEIAGRVQTSPGGYDTYNFVG